MELPVPPSPYQKYRLFIAGALAFVALALWSRPVFFLMNYEPPREEAQVLYCAPPEITGLSPEELEEQRADLNDRFMENLTGADNIESRLVGDLLDPALTDATRITREFMDTNPDNAFVAMHYLHACSNNSQSEACDQALLSAAADLNSNNSAAWNMLAIYRNATGDDFGSTVAMRQAANAPEFDDMLPRNFQIIRDGIPNGISIFSDPILGYLFGRGVGLNMVNYRTYSVCTIATEDEQLYSNCLAFGELMETQSSNYMGEMLGRATQQTAFQMLGDTGNYNRMNQVILDANESRSYDLNRRLANDLMFWDEDLANQWFDIWIESGERAAQEFVLDEAIRRSADPDYQPCPRPGIRFEFPFFYYGDQRVAW